MKPLRPRRVESRVTACRPALRASLPSVRSTLLLFTVLLAGAVPATRATSVVPPSFSELVAEAEAIYRGRVTGVATRRARAPDGTAILRTYVTLAVDRTLKGAERSAITLDFLGGSLDDESLVVTGMPRFALGATEYVFVQRNGIQYCPLVALGHGRYRLLRDDATGREYVARDNGIPLTDPAEVVVPLHAGAGLPGPVRAAQAAAALARALTPAAFESAVLAEARSPTVRARQD